MNKILTIALAMALVGCAHKPSLEAAVSKEAVEASMSTDPTVQAVGFRAVVRISDRCQRMYTAPKEQCLREVREQLLLARK